MKTNVFRAIILISGLVLASCTQDHMFPGGPGFDDDSSKSDLEYDDEKEQDENNTNGIGTYITTGSLSELKTFDIDFDRTPLSGTEDIPSDPKNQAYEDYVENYDAINTVEIIWDGTSVSAKGATDKVKVTHDGSDVTIRSGNEGMRYVLKGKGSDAMLSVYSDYKFELALEDLTLANSDGPAINIQSGKRAYVVLKGSGMVL